MNKSLQNILAREATNQFKYKQEEEEEQKIEMTALSPLNESIG